MRALDPLLSAACCYGMVQTNRWTQRTLMSCSATPQVATAHCWRRQLLVCVTAIWLLSTSNCFWNIQRPSSICQRQRGGGRAAAAKERGCGEGGANHGLEGADAHSVGPPLWIRIEEPPAPAPVTSVNLRRPGPILPRRFYGRLYRAALVRVACWRGASPTRHALVRAQEQLKSTLLRGRCRAAR